jgi:hypothetical protein
MRRGTKSGCVFLLSAALVAGVLMGWSSVGGEVAGAHGHRAAIFWTPALRGKLHDPSAIAGSWLGVDQVPLPPFELVGDGR